MRDIITHANSHANSDIILERVNMSRYEDYRKMFSGDTIWEKLLNVEDLCTMDTLWNNMTSKEELNYSIIKNSDDSFCGYCGFSKFETPTPEIHITIVKRCQRKGIGYESLNMMISEYREQFNPEYIFSRVMVDNIASQNLMKKLGGNLSGIMPIDGVSEKVRELMEENTYLINDRMRDIAANLNIAPQKLLTHALLYKL